MPFGASSMRRSFSREMFSSPMMRMKKVDAYGSKFFTQMSNVLISRV
jgi:hypothetical protein